MHSVAVLKVYRTVSMQSRYVRTVHIRAPTYGHAPTKEGEEEGCFGTANVDTQARP